MMEMPRAEWKPHRGGAVDGCAQSPVGRGVDHPNQRGCADFLLKVFLRRLGTERKMDLARWCGGWGVDPPQEGGRNPARMEAEVTPNHYRSTQRTF